jgi:hypothetical protein
MRKRLGLRWYGSVSKGSIRYTDWDKVKREGGIALGVTFNFTSEHSQQQDPQPYVELTERDIPQRIAITEERHRLLEK